MSYETNLKSWGDTGLEYPDAYSYQDGVPPVDRWDNFLIHNIIEDINFLLEHTQNIDTHKADPNAHHSENHASEQHNSDDLHNDAVGIPTYSSLSNVPAIPAGHAVVVAGDLYVEDGTTE